MFEGYNYVDKTGKGAKDRFTNPEAVRAIYDHLSTEDLPDANRRKKIRALYDGNLPYDPKKLESSAQKNLANINTMGLKGAIDSRANAILRLQSDTANLIELRPIARELAGPDAAKVGRVVSEEFSTLLREKGAFIAAIARMSRETDLFGLGPITWPSALDYCPVALDRAQIRFVGNGPVSSSEHELFMFESTLTADYLRFLLDNPETAESSGWNVTQIKEWLIKAFYHGEDTRSQPGVEGSTTLPEAALSYVRRNILGDEKQFQQFHVIHVFVKEVAWPRGITHIIMPATAKDAFLFQSKHAYRNMDECFLWYPYNVVERYAKEVRGLASYRYAIERTNNRLTCQIVDAAFLASTMILSQVPGTAQAQDITINEQGRYTILPAGFAPAQSQVKPDLQSLMGVKQALDQIGTNAITGSDMAPVSTTGTKAFDNSSKQQTKTEMEIQQRLKAHQNVADHAQRQDVLNKICRQSFLRALRLALMNPIERIDYPEIDDWVRRCEMRGVTLEQMMMIPQLFTIVACRDLALGAEGKVDSFNNFLQVHGGTIDEPGRKFIARESARLLFGQRDADQILPEVSRDQAPNDQASFATMENNQMKMGFQVVVGQDQLHWSHIPIHAQLLQEIAEMVAAPQDNTPDLNEFNGDPEQSMQIGEQTLQNIQEDPKKILGILTMASKHVQEHLQIGGMQIGMQAQAKQVEKMIRDLRPTVKALNLAVATQERVERAKREEQEREMQALQEQASQAEIEKAKYKIDRDAEIAKYKVDKEDEVNRMRLENEARRGYAQDEIAANRAAGEESRRERETMSKLEAQKKISDAKVSAAESLARQNASNEITGRTSVPPSDIAAMGTEENELNYMSL